MVRSADGASIVVTLGTPDQRRRPPPVTAKNMTWTVGAGITDLAGNAITTPASYTETDCGRGLLMAAARSRLAVALAALGIAFAACLGGDHGAARAAVGNATGPLIGSPLAGAAILDGQRPGARATCARARSR